MIKLDWEESISGLAFYKKTKLKTVTPSKAKKFVKKKMKGVCLISVDISDHTVVFEPYFLVCNDFDDRIEFLGIYSSSYTDNIFKRICIRRSTWVKSNEYSKNGVIRSFFYDGVEQSDLLAICASIIGHIEMGASFIDKKEQTSRQEYLNISFFNSAMKYEIEYSPNIKQDLKLESLITQFFSAFDPDKNLGLTPTANTHRVSFEEGVFDC